MTPFKMKFPNATKETLFRVLETATFMKGSIVKLEEDDRSQIPFFMLVSGDLMPGFGDANECSYVSLNNLEEVKMDIVDRLKEYRDNSYTDYAALDLAIKEIERLRKEIGEEEPKYVAGDWFLDESNEECILAQVEAHKFCLVHAVTGNRLHDPVYIKGKGNVDRNEGFTMQEMIELFRFYGDGTLTQIENPFKKKNNV
jgi:hypothetical protein